jgi:hypothetical protein
LGTELKSLRHEAALMVAAVRRNDNEFDLRRLLGLLNVPRS